jgi:hypothetical protein
MALPDPQFSGRTFIKGSTAIETLAQQLVPVLMQ